MWTLDRELHQLKQQLCGNRLRNNIRVQDSIMQCLTELTPPTAVTHALYLPFLGPSSNNLVVAKTSLLQIFTLKTVTAEAGTRSHGTAIENIHHATRREFESDSLDQSYLASDITLQKSERIQSTKLVLVSEFTLSGTILSIARVKTLGSLSGGEALLVAFKDAKLSLVEWDPQRNSIATISIHYYEREDLQGSPWTPPLSQCVNYLTVDPSSRCAALKFGARNLAILPFHQAGDDLVMDDYDPDIDGDHPEHITSTEQSGGRTLESQTPYASSFVLPISALDPSLIHPVHLAFLYEYREPTFGILSSQTAASVSLLHERHDILAYTVFTLDLEQRASTSLLSVSGLPYDLHRVIPLPLPVGGALLVGANELIHVDQAGKTNGVGINEFAKHCSSFAMADQSELSMKLEGCTVEHLGADNGDMLIILQTGQLAILGFRLDGRSVSGISVRRVAETHGGQTVLGRASCAATLGRGRLFVGSEDSDSVILGWARQSDRLKRKRSQAGLKIKDENESTDADDMDDDDDDDLYSGAAVDSQQEPRAPISQPSADGDYVFKIHDFLSNLAPLSDNALGRPSLIPDGEDTRSLDDAHANLDLVSASGRGRAGGFTVLKREIDPKIISRFNFRDAHGIWSVSTKKTGLKGAPIQPSTDSAANGAPAVDNCLDNFMIVSQTTETGAEESKVYALMATGFEEMLDTEFESAAGGTIDVGILAGGTRVVQALKGQIRSYDGDFGLAQIYPMTDELTGAEPKIVSTSFADPYVLVVRDDASIMVLEADDSGDLDEVERGDILLATKWLAGSLYKDTKGAFSNLRKDQPQAANTNVFMFLLGANGGLQVFQVPDLANPVYTAESLSFLPPYLSAEYTVKRSVARETITEILVADIGDRTASSPYLILRDANDDLTIYEPYNSPVDGNGTSDRFALRFLKIQNPQLAKSPIESAAETITADEQGRNQPLRAVPDVGGYSTVFVAGVSPRFVLKSASTLPRVFGLRGNAVKSMSGFNTDGCHNGVVYIDFEGNVRISQLPPGVRFGESSWLAQKKVLGEEVQALSYHPSMEVYVLGTSRKVDFKLPEDDDFHHEWKSEEISLRPQIDQGFVRLLSPINWSIIDTYELDHAEFVMCIRALNLEISENTHERQDLIAVGTAIIQGEDLPARGCIYVFEVINVVPEPDRPETDRKLKLIAKEEVKGAVTALSEIGTQGFLLEAQGQKCMVRGLKEDGSLLPVAFMDMQCYVSVARELKGTGLCVMGDAVKGVWFTGYSEEPYQMRLFGKYIQNLEVIAADFLPDGKQLYIVVADAECNIHILQFDPEHPKSLSGQRLLHRSIFHHGHFTSSLTLLPRTPTSSEFSAASMSDEMDTDTMIPESPPYQILMTTQTGSLALITPLNEQVYRRLQVLQTQLVNTLDHPCGLNPRAYRVAESDGTGGRGMLDGALLRRWTELGSQRKAEVAGRVGVANWVVRGDLDMIGGSGLGYL